MGALVSKLLAEDALQNDHGTLYEVLNGALDQDSAHRGSMADAAQRQQLFAFCADWDATHLTAFLRWCTWLAQRESLADGDKLLDLRGMQQRVDSEAREVRMLEALLSQMDQEREVMMRAEGNVEGDAEVDVTRTKADAEKLAELDARRRSAMEELEQKRRAVVEGRARLLATIDGVDLTLSTQWRHYVQAAAQVKMHRHVQMTLATLAKVHPAAIGYAMTREPDVEKALEEYRKGDVLLPPPANHEIDGFTDDSASESAASEDEKSDDASDDDEKEEARESVAGEASLPIVSGDIIEGFPAANEARMDGSNGNDDNDDEDGEDEPLNGGNEGVDTAQPQAIQDIQAESHEPQVVTAAATTEEGTAENDRDIAKGGHAPIMLSSLELSRKPRVIKRELPPAFDPSKRSPVFFGYSIDKLYDELDEVTSENNEQETREEAVFQAKIQHRRSELEATQKAERGRLDALQQKEAELVGKRERYWERRNAEMEKAKKELDPADIFFRTRAVQDKKTYEQQALEDEEISHTKANIERRMASAQDDFDKLLERVKLVRSTDCPVGDQRLRFHEEEIARYQAEMEVVKKALKIANEEYAILKSAKKVTAIQTPQQRSQLLFAEDQIRAKEKELEGVCELYGNELFLMKRAEEALEREKLVLPFFMCMQRNLDAAIPANAEFSVLEMAMTLLLGLGKMTAEDKVRFVFQAFARHAVPHALAGISSVDTISREALAEVFRLFLRSLSRLGDLHPRREFPREQWQQLADRAFLDLDLPDEDAIAAAMKTGMTSAEFLVYSKSTIQMSKYLCDLLQVPWMHDQLSRYVVQNMSASHQYKLGLINVNDLKIIVARQLIVTRPELSIARKSVIHERALAMGENDPLKTDYSKYLPKRSSKLLSKVVPLDHGGYHNLLHFRLRVILRATTRLQTAWRARKGRQRARNVAERQAFYHARAVALQEARESVEKEWKERDAQPVHTVDKMKFEARIRMKQVKLRTKGHAFNREQVYALLVDEAVQKAQREVENRFREMEEELGYLEHNEALTKPHEDVDYLKDDIAKALVAEVVEARQETEQVAAMKDAIAISEQAAEKKKKKKIKTVVGNQEPQGPPATNINADSDKHVIDIEEQARLAARSTQRKQELLVGRDPLTLGCHGLTHDEAVLEMTLAFPDPPLRALCQRLQQTCCGMTNFKLDEFLQELPSKRHICAYASAFRRLDGSYDMSRMDQDLFEHFRMVRGSTQLAEALAAIAETDLEAGKARRIVDDIRGDSERVLALRVTTESAAIAKTNAEATAKKLARMGYKEDQSESNDEHQEPAASEVARIEANPGALLQQKLQHDATERRMRLRDAQARFLDARKKWREADLSIHAMDRMQLRLNQQYPVLPHHRTNWSERFNFALALPEDDSIRVMEKHNELVAVCDDFLTTAAAIARVIVREFPLPLSQKTILPFEESVVDGRRDEVRSTIRMKFEAHGIMFKVCTDDHGRFENSDEFAAKFAGHEVRNSSLYRRALAGYKNVYMPLECTVDFLGFRVLCVSKMAVETILWSESGTTIQRVSKQLLHGSDNRGKTITFQSKELDAILADAATRLNLSRHSVRGYQDLTSKILHAPADLLGYVNESKQFILLRFARVMPPEDPEMTPHLCQSTRGMSILWRQLRPELVRDHPSALSSDALSLMTYCTPDWQAQALAVEAATKRLTHDVIPQFARKLSQQPNYFTAASFDLIKELHRHGINIRHLGLLRAQFLYPLAGTATLQYATAEIKTSEDFTRQVERGAPLWIEGKAYHVSRHMKDRFEAQYITLNEAHTGASVQNIKVYGGRQECAQQAASIRTRLLAEMIARTLKNVLRHFLRLATKGSGMGLTSMQFKQVIVHTLNLFTGSATGSEAFWNTQMYEGIRMRFGTRAISEVDRQNLRRNMLSQIGSIIRHVATMVGLRIRDQCWPRLQEHPDCYVFVVDDLEGVEDHYRVKHNLGVLHFSMASLLLLQATLKQATSYKQLIVADSPHGYWPLCERRGTARVANLGSYGDALSGRYVAECTLEVAGPIVNTDLNRAVEFRKQKRSYVGFPFVARLYPVDAEAHVSLEVWCKCDGHESTRRVALTMGRFTICAMKANVWAFSFNVRNIDIFASGGPVQLHVWTHLVGVYDGTMLRLYVDGALQNEVEVAAVVVMELEKREAGIAQTRQDIADREEDARGACFKQVEKEVQEFLTTKEGKQYLKKMSQGLLDEHDFRVRLASGNTAATTESPKATADTPKNGGEKAESPTAAPLKRDLSRASRSDFEPLAKKQLIRERFEQRIPTVLREFTEMRRQVNLKIEKDNEEQANMQTRELRIGCLSSVRRRDGKAFFHGCIAHVAYYNGVALTRDQVNAHYVLGVRDRAHISDDLFALASSRFARALEDAPDDSKTLEKFAENICASLKYDLDHQFAREMYKKKVRCGLQPLLTTENANGVAEILKNLPRELEFSDLFVYCYRSLLVIQPDYFQSEESPTCRVALPELARMPFAFFLGSKAANALVSMVEREDEEVPIFADIIIKVLAVFPTFYGDQLTDMGWLRKVTNPRVVVYFILAMEGGEDARFLDFKDVLDLRDQDLDVVVRHTRFALGYSLARCDQLSDASLQRLSLCCPGIERLDISSCSGLGDTGLCAIGKHCSRLKRLRVDRCHLLTDMSIETVVRSNPQLEELSVCYCERISDRGVAAIGAHCRNLAALELEMCVQIGNSAMKALAAMTNAAYLRVLNIAGCHRITDDGVASIARKCTGLRHLSIRLCDRLSDASLRLLTHNCLELEDLKMEEVGHATFKLFLFDQEGDGRGVVEKNLVRRLRSIDLTACVGMTDLALGHLLHRAKQLEALGLSSCTGITDQGLVWVQEDMLDHSTTGTCLTQLDLSYCPQLTPEVICSMVVRCPRLIALNFGGCIGMTDDQVVAIVSTCKLLVRIDVGYCHELTDRVVVCMAEHLALEDVGLARCSKVTDDAMQTLVAQMPALKKLNVSACKKLSDQTLRALAEHCRALQELDITHCPLFSQDVVATLIQRRVRVIGAAPSGEPAIATSSRSKQTTNEEKGDEREEADEQNALRSSDPQHVDELDQQAHGTKRKPVKGFVPSRPIATVLPPLVKRNEDIATPSRQQDG